MSCRQPSVLTKLNSTKVRGVRRFIHFTAGAEPPLRGRPALWLVRRERRPAARDVASVCFEQPATLTRHDPRHKPQTLCCVLGSRCAFGWRPWVGRGQAPRLRLRRTQCGGRRGAALPDPPSCRFLDCHNPTKEGLYELKQLENPARCVEKHAHAHAPGSASASSPSPSGGAVTFGATMLMGCRFTSPIGVPAGSSVTDR